MLSHCRSWEEEKANLAAQIDGLKRELKGLPGRRTRSSAGGFGHATSDEEDANLRELREELDRAKENEVGYVWTMSGQHMCAEKMAGQRGLQRGHHVEHFRLILHSAGAPARGL